MRIGLLLQSPYRHFNFCLLTNSLKPPEMITTLLMPVMQILQGPKLIPAVQEQKAR